VLNDRICIYCPQTDPSRFHGVEHVMPRGFGRFGSGTPTLDSVCDDCNDYFGRELNQLLTRDTYEGISRYSRGKNLGYLCTALASRSQHQAIERPVERSCPCTGGEVFGTSLVLTDKLTVFREVLEAAASAGLYQSVLDEGPEIGILLLRFRECLRPARDDDRLLA
jgi:hypothetical protein